ncbi:MAG: Asp-tRNA(Asn)/Glu-tRNA(Gln) amidotransferase subunit GatC [Candidatus Diapherotrites archaeon]|nr:Asp-tRNA(Asn)/Glu-tRNA(Gln) amidotransferase subunit GatC [Candidatus Diapherotrites archaeon]
MAQKIDRGLLLRVAKNARLNLSRGEIEEFLPQLQEIVLAFQKISEIGAEKEKPSFQPINVENVFREDVVKECLSQQEALKNTLHKKNGFFKGPKVL